MFLDNTYDCINARPFGVVKRTKVEPSAPTDVVSTSMQTNRQCMFSVPKIVKNAQAPSRIIKDTRGVRPQPVLEANTCFAMVRKRMLVCVIKDTSLPSYRFRQLSSHMRDNLYRPKLNDRPQCQHCLTCRAEFHCGDIYEGVGSAKGHLAGDEKNKSCCDLFVSVI